MARSRFVFSVLELRHERAEPKPVEVEAPVDWHLELSRVLPDPPLRAAVDLIPTSGGILARGSVAATVRNTCHRCLDEWDEEIDVPIAQLFVAGEDDDADYVVSGAEVDLEPMIRDEILLALPLVPTCPRGCAQVVQGAESDLNVGSPDVPDEPASPFAVLKDLLDDGT
jgi:uncharacterized protein